MRSLCYIILIGLSIACASKQQVDLGESTSNIYISGGAEKYFLPNLPLWANFSSAGNCFRKTPIRYLNFENISASYDLSYRKMLHMQHMINRKLYAYKSSTGSEQLSPRDEAYIFNNAYQQALGGSYDFRVPQFKKISVLWIDTYLNNPGRVKGLLSRADISQGFPILLSHCLSAYELEELAVKYKWDELGVKYLSADMLSIYDTKSKRVPSFSMHLNSILPHKDITVFGVYQSAEIRGKFKFVKIK